MNYWYKHYYNEYSTMLESEFSNDYKNWMIETLAEDKNILNDWLWVLTHGGGDVNLILGRANAINTLLGYNHQILARHWGEEIMGGTI